MPNRTPLRETLADRFELPAGAAGVVKVTLMGTRRALVEGTTAGLPAIPASG